MYDLWCEGRWERKGIYVFYLQLVTDLLHLVVYLLFFIIVFTHYALPLHLVGPRITQAAARLPMSCCACRSGQCLPAHACSSCLSQASQACPSTLDCWLTDALLRGLQACMCTKENA